MSTLKVSDPAPDFALPANDGRTYRLSDFGGRPVVLAFYVADSGPLSNTCTRQLRSYSDRWDELDREGVVLAIARASVESHKRFAQKNGLKIPLLSDRDGSVVRAYGVTGPLGITRRSLFVIDRDGLVAWKHVDPIGITYRTATEVIGRIRELAGDEALCLDRRS